jgi:hypothetical protein
MQFRELFASKVFPFVERTGNCLAGRRRFSRLGAAPQNNTYFDRLVWVGGPSVLRSRNRWPGAALELYPLLSLYHGMPPRGDEAEALGAKSIARIWRIARKRWQSPVLERGRLTADFPLTWEAGGHRKAGYL